MSSNVLWSYLNEIGSYCDSKKSNAYVALNVDGYWSPGVSKTMSFYKDRKNGDWTAKWYDKQQRKKIELTGSLLYVTSAFLKSSAYSEVIEFNNLDPDEFIASDKALRQKWADEEKEYKENGIEKFDAAVNAKIEELGGTDVEYHSAAHRSTLANIAGITSRMVSNRASDFCKRHDIAIHSSETDTPWPAKTFPGVILDAVSAVLIEEARKCQ